ncbi:MAG: DUF481 domain-containing protein [Saprospiraceae bacterium]|nr:DUF481 domain-containing protein [Saprospiraceae bacterium]
MRFSTYALSLLFCAVYSLSTAQLVNIESQRLKGHPEGFVGSLGFHYNFFKNVSKLSSIGMNVHVQLKKDRDLYLFMGELDRTRVNESDFSNESFIHLRYTRDLDERTIRWELFTQLQRNTIRLLHMRALLGGGPRFKLTGESEKFKLYFASLYMFEYEDEIEFSTHRNHRQSSYLSFTIAPNDAVRIISTTYYQPLWSDFSDFRLLTDFNLSVKLTTWLTLTSRFYHLRDSDPPGDAPDTTYRFVNGLRFTFSPTAKKEEFPFFPPAVQM